MKRLDETSQKLGPEVRTTLLEELAVRREITLGVEHLLGLFSVELVKSFDDHQRNIAGDFAKESVVELISNPAPMSTEADKELAIIGKANVTDYDGEIEDLIYEDAIILGLLEHRQYFADSKEFSELIRLRRTIIAHYLFSILANSEIDDSLPTIDEVIDFDEVERKNGPVTAA